MLGTIFQFPIFFKGEESGQFSRQFRFVAASTEEEAIAKLDEYRKIQIEAGFANFTYADPVVELESVIM